MPTSRVVHDNWNSFCREWADSHAVLNKGLATIILWASAAASLLAYIAAQAQEGKHHGGSGGGSSDIMCFGISFSTEWRTKASPYSKWKRGHYISCCSPWRQHWDWKLNNSPQSGGWLESLHPLHGSSYTGRLETTEAEIGEEKDSGNKVRIRHWFISVCRASTFRMTEPKTHILCGSSNNMEPIIRWFDIHPLRDKDKG